MQSFPFVVFHPIHRDIFLVTSSLETSVEASIPRISSKHRRIHGLTHPRQKECLYLRDA
jgi:hypothetical protein